jgi:hypothetical protein
LVRQGIVVHVASSEPADFGLRTYSEMPLLVPVGFVESLQHASIVAAAIATVRVFACNEIVPHPRRARFGTRGPCAELEPEVAPRFLSTPSPGGRLSQPPDRSAGACGALRAGREGRGRDDTPKSPAEARLSLSVDRKGHSEPFLDGGNHFAMVLELLH